MLKIIERFLKLSTFMIFCCFAIHAWIFDYLKTVSKLHIPKKLVMANLKHIWYYVVL